jgi:AmmeMemoRadiSam system protein A
MSIERQILPALARHAIEEALGAQQDGGLSARHDADWLQAPGASFVTLTQQGRLRGCIGTLEAHRALRIDVEANAVAAALHDPRFMPLQLRELGSTRVEVSVLSAPESMPFESEADALARLRPGLDGIVLQYGSRRSTFLPQVWDQLPEPTEFISQLKRKAGLPDGFWHSQISLQRYTVAKYQETA